MDEPRVIFEDGHVLVIDKPADLTVGASLKKTPSKTSQKLQTRSLEDWLERHKPKHTQLDRLGIVHRLDKDTTGVMVVAKTKLAQKSLADQFKKRVVTKEYTTIVVGRLEPRRGSLTISLARDPKRKKPFKVVPFQAEIGRGRLRQSTTRWKVGEYYQIANKPSPDLAKKNLGLSDLSAVSIRIKTGRTHQIRLVMHHLGHPVVGDLIYSTKTSRQISQLIKADRQMLHASRLTFSHPQTGQLAQFESTLPADMRRLIGLIKPA